MALLLILEVKGIWESAACMVSMALGAEHCFAGHQAGVKRLVRGAVLCVELVQERRACHCKWQTWVGPANVITSRVEILSTGGSNSLHGQTV